MTLVSWLGLAIGCVTYLLGYAVGGVIRDRREARRSTALPAAKPPAGYAPCPMDCGRYTRKHSGACWKCQGYDHGGKGTNNPDWTLPPPPPLLCRACEAPVERPFADGCCTGCHVDVRLEVDNAIDPWPALEARS